MHKLCLRRKEPTTIVLEGYLTDKSDDSVEHLNTILAQRGGNLNGPIFESSNIRALPNGGGEGKVKVRVDRRIKSEKIFQDTIMLVIFIKTDLHCLKVALIFCLKYCYRDV